MVWQKLLILTVLTGITSAEASDILSILNQKIYQRDYDTVISETEALLEDDSNNVDLLILQSRALYHNGQIQHALMQYERAYALEPSDHALALDYALKLSGSGSTSRAAEVYKKLYQADNTDRSVIRPYARIIYEAGEYRSAIPMYTALVSYQPADWSAHRFLAKCYSFTGKNQKASEHFQKAYDLVPHNTNIVYDYAKHEYTLNRLDHALELLASITEPNAATMKIMLLRADSYFKQHEYTLAIPIYNKLLMKGLQSKDVYKRMGFAYFVIGAYPRSHELLNLAVEMGDGDAATFYYMAKCLEYSKQYEEAIATFEKCLEAMQPKYLSDLYESMGSIYAVMDDYPNAIDNLSIAMEMNQESHLIKYFLADAYDSYYEDKSVALEYYKKASEGSISPRIDDYIDHRITEISSKLFLKQ